MSVKDVIKSSVYQSLGGGTQLSTQSIIFTLVVAVLIGVYIFWVYKLSSKAAFYSRDLNITIAGMPLIVATMMIAMQSNLIVSLGMVGALSIVRFRTAVKNPLDLLYLFWSISAGIICGVGLKALALLLCIMMTILILVLQMLPNFKPSSVLVIRAASDKLNWEEAESVIRKMSKNVKEKSRSSQRGETEVIYELSTSKEELVKELEKIQGVSQVHLLAHDGEYRI